MVMSDDRPLTGRDEHELDGGHGDESHSHGNHDHAHGDAHDHAHSDDHDHAHSDDHDHAHGHHHHAHGHHHHAHGHHHHDVETLGAAVVTVSTSRSLDDDPAGDAVAAAFEDAGHEVATRDLVTDEIGRASCRERVSFTV